MVLAVCYIDAWPSYLDVLPQKRYQVVAKNKGKTNPIEGFNNTLCQRTPRLARKTLPFS